MSKLLKVLGVLSVLGGIYLGIKTGYELNETAKLLRIKSSFQWSSAIAWWVSGLISGVLFFAISMILDHLDEVRFKLYLIKEDTSKSVK